MDVQPEQSSNIWEWSAERTFGLFSAGRFANLFNLVKSNIIGIPIDILKSKELFFSLKILGMSASSRRGLARRQEAKLDFVKGPRAPIEFTISRRYTQYR